MKLGMMLCAVCVVGVGLAGAEEPLIQRRENFTADPKWEGFRNGLLVPGKFPHIKQDFGYSATNYAGGKSPGEIGGTIQRAIQPAWYARVIKPLTLNDSFSASGTFAARHVEGGSGAMIGWFHESSRGWRTPNSVGFRIDGNGNRFWAFYEYGTTLGRTAGAGAFEGERYQTTSTLPFKGDGKPHRWKLAYDPKGGTGQGGMRLAIDETTYPEVAFSAEDRADGMTLNRFGIWNVQIAGAPLELYVDDLVLNGELISFDQDPKWEGKNNRREHDERIVRPFHDFGFNLTNHLGGTGGELGGVIFRDEKPAYYGTDVGRLTLNDRLKASGRILLEGAAADSGVSLGWFQSEAKRNQNVPEYERRSTDRLGIMIEGPSRVGHYFRADYSTSEGGGILDGPDVAGTGELAILRTDGKVHTWKIDYDPEGAGGRGEIEVVFDGASRKFALRPGDRARGATFDRFGMFNLQAGGHHVQVWIDELQFTSRK
ncbi:MAG: hypothetical protein U0903_08975 [Planctomycetales bacterium]